MTPTEAVRDLLQRLQTDEALRDEFMAGFAEFCETEGPSQLSEMGEWYWSKPRCTQCGSVVAELIGDPDEWEGPPLDVSMDGCTVCGGEV